MNCTLSGTDGANGDAPVTFSLDAVAAATGMPDAYVIGAGGGCNKALRDHSGELMHLANVPRLRGGSNSRVARVDPESGECHIGPFTVYFQYYI